MGGEGKGGGEVEIGAVGGVGCDDVSQIGLRCCRQSAWCTKWQNALSGRTHSVAERTQWQNALNGRTHQMAERTQWQNAPNGRTHQMAGRTKWQNALNGRTHSVAERTQWQNALSGRTRSMAKRTKWQALYIKAIHICERSHTPNQKTIKHIRGKLQKLQEGLISFPGLNPNTRRVELMGRDFVAE